MNTLYKYDKYLNKNIEYLIGNEIIEYDIKSAGFNIIKCFKLLPDKDIALLDKMGKKQKQIAIGKYQLKYPELKTQLQSGFAEARRIFFTNNNIEEVDVLSIKKDAIFLLKPCRVTKFKNIEFVPKNVYSSYYYLNKLELYYNEDGIDIKGIIDDNLKLHSEGFLLFLHDIMTFKEREDDLTTIKFIKDFSHEYKTHQLPIEFYRELNVESMYKLKMTLHKNQIYIKDIGEEQGIQLIDTSYNFTNFIIPFLKILI